jgi:hypothetical protein
MRKMTSLLMRKPERLFLASGQRTVIWMTPARRKMMTTTKRLPERYVQATNTYTTLRLLLTAR